jgi:hypothetical protein
MLAIHDVKQPLSFWFPEFSFRFPDSACGRSTAQSIWLSREYDQSPKSNYLAPDFRKKAGFSGLALQPRRHRRLRRPVATAQACMVVCREPQKVQATPLFPPIYWS